MFRKFFILWHSSFYRCTQRERDKLTIFRTVNFLTMKKTFLTLVAFGFGASVAFAQTPVPQEETQQGVQTEQDDATLSQEEEGRTQIEMYELPVAVQDAFKNGQYKDYEVLAIYEVSAEPQEGAATEMEGTEGATVAQGVTYEIELASEGESYGTEQAVEDGMEGVETERVSARQPDVVLQFDANGQLINEEQPEEEDKY